MIESIDDIYIFDENSGNILFWFDTEFFENQTESDETPQ